MSSVGADQKKYLLFLLRWPKRAEGASVTVPRYGARCNFCFWAGRSGTSGLSGHLDSRLPLGFLCSLLELRVDAGSPDFLRQLREIYRVAFQRAGRSALSR